MSLTFDYITQEDIKLPQYIQDLMTVEYLSTFRDRLDEEFKDSNLKKTYWGFYQEIEDYGGLYNVLSDLNKEWIDKGGKEIFEWLCSLKDFFEWESMIGEITRLMVVKGVIEKGTIDDCMMWYSEGKEI